ncbi:MAG: hypothetical protein KKA76_11125, partial [Proteobacteria bacterium]|nr:hypothetical protein [Pseudomonadota bacterium]
MDITTLVISLIIGIVGIFVITYGYRNDQERNPRAAQLAGKKIAVLLVVVAVVNSSLPVLNYLKQQAAAQTKVGAIAKVYVLEKQENPSIEEVKNEMEKGLKDSFEKKKKQALALYQEGIEAYESGRVMEAIPLFGQALAIIEAASFYLARGNSYSVASNFESAREDFTAALRLYKND